MNLPTWLTLLRILLIPVLIIVFYSTIPGSRMLSALVFIVASLSDWLDGFLARRMSLTSRFGEFLDPVADKLMVAAALIILLQDHPTFWLMLPTVVIIGREITISALREWMAEIGKRTHVAVSIIGKFKTATQMIAIILLLYRDPIMDFPVYQAGMLMLYIAAALTLWSMINYLSAAWVTMRQNDA
ncbi:MAG: CDP-diacylglycerol--glycerol-3-phosphate 3-phosphatidyltransferase [Gammaproteobacteria bacterium]|nr:MAG: CDP-diacylglycerol--glycerol-3-phosphate 3-phosphatidyltransferase [Gammaproteobacteria bacterium]